MSARYFLQLVAGALAIRATSSQQASVAEGLVQSELSQMQQLRSVVDEQRYLVSDLTAAAQLACHKLWQVDAFVTIQDFGSGESGENMLNALKELGFAPQVVYDIGANNGASAELLLELWGADGSGSSMALHSFEPVPPTYTALEQRLTKLVKGSPVSGMSTLDYPLREYRTSFGSVTLHNAAVSDSDGEMEIFDGLDKIANRGKRSAWATLAKKGTSYGTVKTLTVDNLVRHGLPAPDLVKIDTEGWDYMTLVGMQETLAAQKITVLLFEFSHDTWPRSKNDEATLENAQALLDKYGYDSYLIGDSFHIQLNGGLWADMYEQLRWGNVVAIRRGAPFQLGIDCIDPHRPALKSLPYPCGAKQQCA